MDDNTIAPEHAVAPEHSHTWQPSQEYSNNTITRYQCTVCKHWGWRTWPRSGKVSPIVAYANLGGDGTQPRSTWGVNFEDFLRDTGAAQRREDQRAEMDRREGPDPEPAPEEWTKPAGWRHG